MRPQEIRDRSQGGGRRKVQFDETAIRKMFELREQGVTDADIARRFGTYANKIAILIGRKAVKS